jgi:O-antigen ligase
MKLLRVGICALVVLGVLSHGAVEDWARAILETGAALLLLFWAARAFFRTDVEIVVSPLLPPLIVLALIVVAQFVLHRTVSLFNTRVELQLLVTYIVILFLASQAFREPDDWKGFIWFLMFFGFVVAIFGILQQLTFNGKLYWFREMRYGGIPFGPYVNRNHFAGFIGLVIPVALVPLVLGKVRRERWLAAGTFTLVPIGALFLSGSRGGIVSFAVGLGVLALIMALRRVGGRHVLAGAVVLLLAFLMVSWLGVRQVLERFSSLQSLEVTVGKRASMRAGAWHIFLDHPWIGTGLGTLQIAFPAYETLYDGKIVNHAHNDYLEAAAETGFVGILCCAWCVGALFFYSLRQLLGPDKSFAAALHLSGLTACCAFAAHSLVDFNLHIPANALLFFLMAHLATVEIPSNPSERFANHAQPLRTQNH